MINSLGIRTGLEKSLLVSGVSKVGLVLGALLTVGCNSSAQRDQRDQLDQLEMRSTSSVVSLSEESEETEVPDAADRDLDSGSTTGGVFQVDCGAEVKIYGLRFKYEHVGVGQGKILQVGKPKFEIQNAAFLVGVSGSSSLQAQLSNKDGRDRLVEVKESIVQDGATSPDDPLRVKLKIVPAGAGPKVAYTLLFKDFTVLDARYFQRGKVIPSQEAELSRVLFYEPARRDQREVKQTVMCSISAT